MIQAVQQIAGTLLVLLVLADVLLTVLYARMGSAILSNHIAHAAWVVFRGIGRLAGRHRPVVLSFCGPVALVLLVAAWGLLTATGVALFLHPYLGDAILANNGPTPTDFLTAMYVAGTSLAITGSSDFAPRTAGLRMLFLFTSLTGMSLVTLTVTYLMQIYAALQRRNELGLKIFLYTGRTGDAAEMIAGFGPQARFESGYTNLSDLGVEMVNAKEAHHFYPVLFYFRFPAAYYSISFSALAALDTVSLIKSGLSDKPYGWLKESAAVEQVWDATMLLVTTLQEVFLSGSPDPPVPPRPEDMERWRRRYQGALGRLRQAGIETMADEGAGFDIYVQLRSRWDSNIGKLAPFMGYSMEEVDPAGCRPETISGREEFQARLHSVK